MTDDEMAKAKAKAKRNNKPSKDCPKCGRPMGARRTQCTRCDRLDAFKAHRAAERRSAETTTSLVSVVAEPAPITCDQCGRLKDPAENLCRWCERERLRTKTDGASKKKKKADPALAGAVIVVSAIFVGIAAVIHHSAPAAAPAQSTTSLNSSIDPEPVSDKAQPSDLDELTYSRTATKQALEAKLKDPGSAEYRNVASYRVAGDYAFCGEVNAKNGFGGYTGYERFVGVPNQAFLESEVTDFDTVWAKFCDRAQKGPPVWW